MYTWVIVRIINKHTEVEWEKTYKALSYPAAAKMAHRDLRCAGIRKPNKIKKISKDYIVWEA